MKKDKIILVIVIMVIFITIIATGGYFFYQKYSTIKIQKQTIDWKTYTNSEYGFEFKYPENLEARQRITSGDCVKGERISFYFYKEGDAPTNSLESGLGSYLFEGHLDSPDYDITECPMSFMPNYKIINTPLQLLSTQLNVNMDVQTSSCSISQLSKFSVSKYYNQKYGTFSLKFYDIDSFPLTSEEGWTTEKCAETFKDNIEKLRLTIEKFDLVANSVKFLNK